jgi:hypothetical protein
LPHDSEFETHKDLDLDREIEYAFEEETMGVRPPAGDVA